MEGGWGGAVAACRTNDVNDIYNKMRETRPLTCDLFLISDTCVRLPLGAGTRTWRVSGCLSHPSNVEVVPRNALKRSFIALDRFPISQ